MNRKQFALLIFVFPLMWTPAYALWSDGKATATENVCHVLKGGTPGLYPLCVAYCGAPDRGHPFAAWLLSIYNKKRAPLDPTMPCNCPCFNEEEVQAAYANDQGYTDPVPFCQLDSVVEVFKVSEGGGVCLVEDPNIEFLLIGDQCQRNIVNGTAGLGECPSNNLPVGSSRLSIQGLNNSQIEACSQLIQNVCQE